MENQFENTSGQGKLATVPAELDRWNWGAFLLNWIWGIGNNTLNALLVFVPFFGLVMPFVLGAKGSAWAWQNKRWRDTAHFKSVQRLWAIWGVAILVAAITLTVVMCLSAVALFKSSDAYTLASTTIQSNNVAIAELGTPISTGFPMGSIAIAGTRGTADVSFSVEGPKAKGTVYADLVRDLGQWKINRMVLELDGSGRRIDLTGAITNTSLPLP